MAEDRFANVFTAAVTMSAADALTWVELNFALNLRDRLAIVIDELYFYLPGATVALMTTATDTVALAITVSDQVTDVFSTGLDDRRILTTMELQRADFGTAAAGQLHVMPLKQSFAPPLLALPNRMYFGMDTSGLASAGTCILRMHYRTVSISSQDQLIEVLETFQLSI